MPLKPSDLQTWEAKVGLILQEEIDRRVNSMALDGTLKLLGMTVSHIRALKEYFTDKTGRPAEEVIEHVKWLKRG